MAEPANDFTLADPDILTVDDVASLLRICVDTVRRIPHERLPVHRPGKRNLYFREDVIRYVKSCRVLPNANIDTLLTEIEGGVIRSLKDGARERSRRRAL